MAKNPKYRPMLREADLHMNNREAVEAWYECGGKIALSLNQDAYRSRLEHAYQLFIRDKDSSFDKATTIRKHANIWKQSEIQSRRDLDTAIDIFAKMDSKDRKSHRAIAIEMALKTYRKADKMGELADMNKATKLYIEATGVDKDDPNIPKAEDLNIPIIEIADELTRLLMERIAQAAQNGNTLDLQNLKVIDLIEGIDYESISNLLPVAQNAND